MIVSAAKETDDSSNFPVAQLQYFDLTKNWRKVKPHLADPKLNMIMRRDFGRFVRGRWRKEFLASQYPSDFDSCDWRLHKKGRRPVWWRYVAHGACHWLANTALTLALLVEPDRQWRIITSNKHSTVWDGDQTLFEFNFQAFGVSAAECFALARDPGCKPKELKPRMELRVGLAMHCLDEHRGEAAQA
ncbi:hypothetical protein [Bradyrhizobium ottawaense]|uniref:hypothetical protein n=1 Tax=Bradyrhizobium ottawaense TaxID=931866 RepID=UPI003394BB99